MSDTSPRIRVGYAFEPKKVQTFIQPSLLDLANQRNIDFLLIDPSKPLINQGAFDCIIHKVYGSDWNHQLQEFLARNPDVPIIDPPEFIERLHNRVSMLEDVKQLIIPTSQRNEKVGIPKQVVIYESERLVNGLEEIGENLRFPVIAKPVLANGTTKSHEMCLVLNSEGLKKLSVPIVLQEFVNHGGVIFKVYVVGGYVKCVKRKSLPDIFEDKLGVIEEGLVWFSQISNFVGDCNDNCDIEKMETPDLGFVEEVAGAMRQAMGLQLFNFDMIRDVKEGNRYLVIDVNYFPGYPKIPGYEKVLTDFLLDVVSKRKKIVSNACGGGYGNPDCSQLRRF